MSVRFVAPFALLVAVAALVGCSRKPPAPSKVDPPIVVVAYPVMQKVNDYEDFAGRTEPVKVVELKSRVSGYLKGIYFKDGQDIDAGKPLFDIDDRIYKAELKTAEAALKSAEARRMKAVADETRTKEGIKNGVNSEFDLDQAVSARGVAEADIGAAQAAIDKAETNLRFCRIFAPFDGRLSKRMVDEENLIKADDTLLTTIVLLDEVYATFDVDERTVMRIRRLIQKGEVTSSRQQTLRVQIALADEDDFSLYGTVVFTDNQVDPGTGTLRVRATIRNPRLRTAPWYLLSPGQFVRVRVPIGPARDAVVVPEKAIGSDQGQRFVYVVTAKNEVERRNVRVGQQYGQLRVVEDGVVTPADRIIVDGLLRVRQGVEVAPKEAEAPKPNGLFRSPEPTPEAPAPHVRQTPLRPELVSGQ
jgi:multidrug efflux system membrane fusion protein